MNDEVKEILIDLIDYYNTVGTESDPGINTFETVAKRASKALERHARDSFCLLYTSPSPRDRG